MIPLEKFELILKYSVILALSFAWVKSQNTTDGNDCMSGPCLNGGTCIRGYYCQCPSNFTGRNCENEILTYVENVRVEPSLTTATNAAGQVVNALQFRCKFDATSNVDSSTFFTVQWFNFTTYEQEGMIRKRAIGNDNEFLNGYPTLIKTVGPLALGDLDQSNLLEKEVNQIGSRIFCAVSTNSSDGVEPTGMPLRKKRQTRYYYGQGVPSPIFFIGIEVTSGNFLSANRGESVDIKVRLTVPFGCSPIGSVCTLTISLFDPDSDPCSGGIGSSGGCGLTISSDAWDMEYTLPVQVQDDGSYTISNPFYEIRLIVRDYPPHRFWSNYQLPPIGLGLQNTDSSILMGKRCDENNDPHMRTFDGVSYELQFGGEFILYRHKTLPFQVNTKTAACGNYGPRSPFCTCGVTVRAGQDFFTVDTCPDTEQKQICRSGNQRVLMVTKVGGGSRYNVKFPTGTTVQIGYISQYSSTFFNVQIVPSLSDVAASTTDSKVEGLCSNLNGVLTIADEFVLRTGGVTTVAGPAGYSFHPDDFSMSWSVGASESLFNQAYRDSLNSYSGGTVCTCPVNPGDPIKCSPSQEVSCDQPSEQPECTDIGSGSSGIGVARRRRSVLKHMRTKRQAPTPAEIQEARDACEAAFLSSAAMQACKDIPGVDINNGIDICIADYLLVGNLTFLREAKGAIETQCATELSKNPALRNPGPSGQSQADLVQAVLCPNDCSGEGTCNNGVCTCNPLRGGPDCAVDLTIAPTLTEVADDGIHDNNPDVPGNDKVVVKGSTFHDTPTLKCKFEKFTMTRDGEKTVTGDMVTVDGDHVTMFQVECPLPALDTSGLSPDVFVVGYSLSVSNDASSFSQSLDVMEINSMCQEVQLDNVSSDISGFSLKRYYCFKDFECKPAGELAESMTDEQLRMFCTLESCSTPPTTTPTTTTRRPRGPCNKWWFRRPRWCRRHG